MTIAQAWQLLQRYQQPTDKGAVALEIACLDGDTSDALTTWLPTITRAVYESIRLIIRGIAEGTVIAPLQISTNLMCKLYNFEVCQKELQFGLQAAVDTLDIKIKGMTTVDALVIRRRPSASVQQLYLKVQSTSLLDMEVLKAKQETDIVMAAQRLRSIYFSDKTTINARKLAIVVHSKQLKEIEFAGKPSVQLQQLVVTHPQLMLNALQEQTLLKVQTLEVILDGCLSSKINLKGIKGVKHMVIPAKEYLTRYKRVLCTLLQTDVNQYLPLDMQWQYMGEIQMQLPDKLSTVTFTSLAYMEHFVHRVTIGAKTEQVYIAPVSAAMPFLCQPRVTTPMLLASASTDVCTLCRRGIEYSGYNGVLSREIVVKKGRV